MNNIPTLKDFIDETVYEHRYDRHKINQIQFILLNKDDNDEHQHQQNIIREHFEIQNDIQVSQYNINVSKTYFDEKLNKSKNEMTMIKNQKLLCEGHNDIHKYTTQKYDIYCRQQKTIQNEVFKLNDNQSLLVMFQENIKKNEGDFPSKQHYQQQYICEIIAFKLNNSTQLCFEKQIYCDYNDPNFDIDNLEKYEQNTYRCIYINYDYNKKNDNDQLYSSLNSAFKKFSINENVIQVVKEVV